jgi:ABC-type antimicrobial peptide transport system permease subunit
MVGLVGATALALMLVGVYGLIARTVVERRTELAIRLALGATRSGAMSRLALHAIGVAACGIVVGVGVSIGATQVVSGLIWGVEPHDPMTLAGTAALTVVVVAGATLVPAWRIMRIDPAEMLRA